MKYKLHCLACTAELNKSTACFLCLRDTVSFHQDCVLATNPYGMCCAPPRGAHLFLLAAGGCTPDSCEKCAAPLKCAVTDGSLDKSPALAHKQRRNLCFLHFSYSCSAEVRTEPQACSKASLMFSISAALGPSLSPLAVYGETHFEYRDRYLAYVP